MGRVLRSQSKKQGRTERTPPDEAENISSQSKKGDGSPRRIALADQTNSFPKPGPVSSSNTIKNYFHPVDKNAVLDITQKTAALTEVQPEKKQGPVYKAVRMSLPKQLAPEQRLNLYEFEVDENEPRAKKFKKKKRIPTNKHKLVRSRKKTAPLKALDQNRRPNKFTPVEPDIICDSNSLEASFGTKTMTAVPCSTPFHAATTEIPEKPKITYTPMEPDVSIIDVPEEAEPSRLSTSFRINSEPCKTPLKPPRVTSEIPILFEDSPVFTREESLRKEVSQQNLQASLSTSHNSIPDVPSSTPVKYNSLCSVSFPSINVQNVSNLDVSNFFGFNEPDSAEEPFVSPIKYPMTPRREPEKPAEEHREEDVPETLPVKQIIKMLRFGDEAAGTSVLDKSDDGDSNGSLLKEVNFFNDSKCTTTEIKENFRAHPRRSYERPFRPRRHNNEDENSSEEEEEEVKRKEKHQQAAKKKNALSKKEQKDFTDWVKSFNSECNQVDKFELCIE